MRILPNKIEKAKKPVQVHSKTGKIFTQMREEAKVDPLIQEAKKYKSAEEFVGDIKNRFGEKTQVLETKDLDIFETSIDRKLVESFKDRMNNGDDSVFLHREAIDKAPAIRIEMVEGKMKVKDGNHRLLAAKELGIKNVPVEIEGYGATDIVLGTSFKKQLTDIYNQAQKS